MTTTFVVWYYGYSVIGQVFLLEGVGLSFEEPTPLFYFMAEETKSEMNQTDVAFAATNAPELAKKGFELGGRGFAVVNLKYKDYLVFFSHLEPLMKGVFNALAVKAGIDSAELSPVNLLNYLGDKLPEMVCIVCRQTEPSTTLDWVLDNAESPFQLARIVLQQIEVSKMVSDVADFFGQSLPMLLTLQKLSQR